MQLICHIKRTLYRPIDHYRLRMTRACRFLCGLFLIFGVFLFAQPAYALSKYADYKVVLITADESDTTKQILSTILKRVPASTIFVDKRIPLKREKNTIYVAIGPNALRNTLESNSEGIVISAFTSSQAYHAIVDGTGDQRSPMNTVTAVFADPAPVDQLRLINAIYKHPVAVGTILSEKTNYLRGTLQQAARKQGLTLQVENLIDMDINKALNQLNATQVLLAVPDNNVYNSNTIRNILLTTYHHNQAVIGFSHSMVNAGALAAVYSDMEDIVSHVEEVIHDVRDSGVVPEPQYPKYFSVGINKGVARSLDLIIDESVFKISRKSKAVN